MSAEVATSPMPLPRPPSRLIRGLLGSAAHIYEYALSHSPVLVSSNIARLESSIAPLTDRIYYYGNPLMDSLDERLDGVVRTPDRLKTLWESLSLYEKTKLYSTALKSWLAHKVSYEEYMTTVKRLYGTQWSDTIKTLAESTHQVLQKSVHIDDVLVLAAGLVSEGNKTVQNGLLHAWNSLQTVSPKRFLEQVKATMGPEWVQTISDKARIFYSLATLQEEIRTAADAAKTRARAIVRRAKDVASKTSFVILSSTDRMMDASIVILDERVVSWLCSAPPPTIQLRGFDRLAEMEQRLHNELALFAKEKKTAVTNSKTYHFLGDKILMFQTVFHDLKSVSKTDLYAKAWPETVKDKVDTVLIIIGLERFVQMFDQKVWERLDQDADRVVTIGDLMATAAKAKEISPMRLMHGLINVYKDTYRRYVKFGRVNGDHED